MNRIEIFIDGNFFYQASNFFRYQHPEKKRLNLEGIFALAKDALSTPDEPAVLTRTRIYRGRHTDPTQGENVFDDYAIRLGVEMNRFPIQNGEEKEVDVSLALDAYEAVKDNYCDAIVLLAGDVDFLPLIKRIHRLGKTTLLIGFNGTTAEGWTKTSYRLVKEVGSHIFLEEKILDPAHAATLLYQAPQRLDPDPLPLPKVPLPASPADEPPGGPEDASG